MNEQDYKKVANLCYEIGTLKKISRSHKQLLLTSDEADNIGPHSHRVSCIAFLLAKLNGEADPYKTMCMAIFHDVPETRSGDQNWTHKRYIKVDENQIIKDQFGGLPFDDISDLLGEYDKRECIESLLAKDADTLDQALLLKEYELSGNKEATIWLNGKDGGDNYISYLKTDVGKRLGEAIMTTSPSDWWSGNWTPKNK